MNIKLFSARFWMAILFTVGTIGLAFYLVHRFPESAAVVWTGVSSITLVIVKDYFGRNDREKPENGNGIQSKP